VHHGVGRIFAPTEAPRTPHLIAAVSDLYVQKNLETLLDAVALLAPRFPELRLELAGRPLDQAYAARLEQQAARLGIAERVTFLGAQTPEQVAALYRRAAVFAFPSLVETFGIPVLEAMASGTPVVCARAAAMPEVAGDAALFAEPGNARSLADQIAKVLDDPALAAELGAKGLERAKGFTWERSAQAAAAVLLEAAGR
jgi:glycosyltransferase involved in cell wall biosynthesis